MFLHIKYNNKRKRQDRLPQSYGTCASATHYSAYCFNNCPAITKCWISLVPS